MRGKMQVSQHTLPSILALDDKMQLCHADSVILQIVKIAVTQRFQPFYRLLWDEAK